MFWSILLPVITGYLLISLFFTHRFTLNITSYIVTVILIFIQIVFHLIIYKLPILLILMMALAYIILLIKHRHLWSIKIGRQFIYRLIYVHLRVILFISACYYISTIPIPVLNGIALWLAVIGISALIIFICYLIWSSAYGSFYYNIDVDLIIVLGAGIFTEQVTPMLKQRLDRALHIYRNQTSPTYFLVSGGQGPDEPITEALAMQRYLIKHQVDPQYIIMEQQSTNTYTNFLYSKDLITQRFQHLPKAVCVTSQFHILRALRLAQKLNLNIDGIGSHTPYHFFSVALIRDFLGLMYQYKLLLTLYFGVLFWVCILRLWFN